MQQSPASSSSSVNSSFYYYPSSPVPGQLYYDSAYATYNYGSTTPNAFQFTSCQYSPDSYYQPSMNYSSYYSPATYPVPLITSTPTASDSAIESVPVKTMQQPPLRRRRQHEQLSASPSMCPARKRISDEAIERLNAFYEFKKRPTEQEKDQLAMECNITVAQVNTWFNNARSRRGDTNPKLTQKLLKQQIHSLNNKVALLQQQQQCVQSSYSSSDNYSY